MMTHSIQHSITNCAKMISLDVCHVMKKQFQKGCYLYGMAFDGFLVSNNFDKK